MDSINSLLSYFCDIITFLRVAIPLSNDHKPDRDDERKRIEQAGGFIIWAGKLLSHIFLM